LIIHKEYIFLIVSGSVKIFPTCGTIIAHSVKVNNPSPEGPALISPQRGGVYPKSSNGMMEWWNNGILGLKTGPPQAD
jgi:hypothetical protein